VRIHILTSFLKAVHDSLLDSIFIFFIDEAWFHLSGHIAENNMYWSSVNLRETSEVPLHDQKIGA
jgi:hypothetical protein